MKWTTEPPKEPGWYWVKQAGSPAASIHFFEDGELVLEGWQVPFPQFVRRHFPIMWTGPIPEPEEDHE